MMTHAESYVPPTEGVVIHVLDTAHGWLGCIQFLVTALMWYYDACRVLGTAHMAMNVKAQVLPTARVVKHGEY
jgi:hypothetical protein